VATRPYPGLYPDQHAGSVDRSRRIAAAQRDGCAFARSARSCCTSRHGCARRYAQLKEARHLQRFASVHGPVANLFMHCLYHTEARQKRTLRTQPFEAWENVACARMPERLAA